MEYSFPKKRSRSACARWLTRHARFDGFVACTQLTKGDFPSALWRFSFKIFFFHLCGYLLRFLLLLEGKTTSEQSSITAGGSLPTRHELLDATWGRAELTERVGDFSSRWWHFSFKVFFLPFVEHFFTLFILIITRGNLWTIITFMFRHHTKTKLSCDVQNLTLLVSVLNMFW